VTSEARLPPVDIGPGLRVATARQSLRAAVHVLDTILESHITDPAFELRDADFDALTDAAQELIDAANDLKGYLDRKARREGRVPPNVRS
jgi:hypothetical protein